MTEGVVGVAPTRTHNSQEKGVNAPKVRKNLDII